MDRARSQAKLDLPDSQIHILNNYVSSQSSKQSVPIAPIHFPTGLFREGELIFAGVSQSFSFPVILKRREINLALLFWAHHTNSGYSCYAYWESFQADSRALAKQNKSSGNLPFLPRLCRHSSSVFIFFTFPMSQKLLESTISMYSTIKWCLGLIDRLASYKNKWEAILSLVIFSR